MKPHMFCVGPTYDEVGRSVVLSIAVPVVHLFTALYRPPEHSFGNDDVLKDIPLTVGSRVRSIEHFSVPLLYDERLLSVRSATGPTAVFRSGSSCLEDCRTVGASRADGRNANSRLSGVELPEIVATAEPAPKVNGAAPIRRATERLPVSFALSCERSAALPQAVAGLIAKRPLGVRVNRSSDFGTTMTASIRHTHTVTGCADVNHYSLTHDGVA